MNERSGRSTHRAPVTATVRKPDDHAAEEALQSTRPHLGELSVRPPAGAGDRDKPGESRPGRTESERAPQSTGGTARQLDTQGTGSEKQQPWGVEPWKPYAWEKATCAFDDAEVEIHPKGLIYIPHERLRNRLNAAFGAGWYKFLPVGDPITGGNEVIWRCRLWFRDGTEGEAVGHAKFIKNNLDYSYGDALETCKSDAFPRCCKDVGIGLQCWNRDYQIYFMRTYGHRYQSTKDDKWYWRRKDRPAPWDERKSPRQMGPDYVPRETLDEENRKHFDSLKPDPEMPSNRVRPLGRAVSEQEWDEKQWGPLTTQPKPLSREEMTWEPETDEQLRRLHEIEDEVFHTDAREGD